MLRQGDMFVDAGDAVILKDAEQLKRVIDALPSEPFLRAYDITKATGMSAQVVSNLRESGAFTAFDVGSKEEPRWRYARESFLKWLKSRMIPGEF